jgi:hypothetical protein
VTRVGASKPGGERVSSKKEKVRRKTRAPAPTWLASASLGLNER